MRHGLERQTVGVAQGLGREGHRRRVVCDELERITGAELVALRQHGASVRRGALYDSADLGAGKVGGVRRILSRLTEVKAGAVRAVADLQHLALPDRGERSAGDRIIQSVAVGICDRADIVGALCASLDLQARDAGIEQRGQMVDHAHIAGVKDICPLFVLSNIKHLAGALGLRETVLPAAGLRTAAAVGIAPGEVV